MSNIAFNPQPPSIAEIQVQLPTQTAQKAKSSIFTALSTFKAEEITAGLGNEHVEKVNELVKSRRDEIAQFVKNLNDLGDLKSEFEENPDYLAYRKASKEAHNALYIEYSARQACREIAESLGEGNLAKYEKWMKQMENGLTCSRQPSINKWALESAVKELVNREKVLRDIEGMYDEERMDNDEHVSSPSLKNTRELVRHCLNDFLRILTDSIIYEEASLDSLKECFSNEDSLAPHISLLEKNFPEAQQRADEIKEKQAAARKKWEDEKESRVATMKATFSEKLIDAQSYEEKLKNDSSFQQYRTGKADLRNKVVELSSFCKKEEIQNHRKITQESVKLFNKMANSLAQSSL
jgi:hypothetical protein